MPPSSYQELAQVCLCTRCAANFTGTARLGAPGLLITKGLAALHRKRDADEARYFEYRKAMVSSFAYSAAAPVNFTSLENNNGSQPSLRRGRSKEMKEERIASPTCGIEGRDGIPSYEAPLVDPYARNSSTSSNSVDAFTSNVRPSSGIKRPPTSTLYPNTSKKLCIPPSLTPHQPVKSAATQQALRVKTEVRDYSKKSSLPTPSFYNEPSLSSLEFDQLLVALGREALTQDMEGKRSLIFPPASVEEGEIASINGD